MESRLSKVKRYCSLEAIKKSSQQNPLDEVLHDKALYLLKIHLIIGGMPEVVANYVSGKDLFSCQIVLNELITTLKNDFSKYRKKNPALQIAAAFDSVVRQTGNKFIYNDKERIQCNDSIVPFEVKSGKQGKMQSLHLFMKEKQSEYGIRTSLENFSQYGKINVIPLYALSIRP